MKKKIIGTVMAGTMLASTLGMAGCFGDDSLVKSFEVLAPTEKMYVGDEFSLDGYVIKFTMADGTTKEVEITEDMIDNMTDEIYRNVEDVGTELSVQANKMQTPLKNGDVRNPNAKEPEIRETRQRNFLLRDLIRILILRELSRPNRPPYRPPVRPPRPPRPPRNPWGGMY